MPKMKLVSMEKPKPRKKSRRNEPESVGDDKYPWNLRLSLDEEQVKKLPHVMKLNAGKEVYIMAKADITRITNNEVQTQTGGDKRDRSIEFQITDISIQGNEKDVFTESFDEE